MTAETAKMAKVPADAGKPSDAITGEVVKRDSLGRKKSNGPRSQLAPHEQLALKREIALNNPVKMLAEKYGMTPQGISEFKRRNALAIDDIREHLDDDFAGLPLAIKKNRIAAYENEVERLTDHPAADHHEWSKARQMAYRSIAEELGQLPPRATITVVPVVHMVEGVDLEELK
jgi:hypothetical protein